MSEHSDIATLYSTEQSTSQPRPEQNSHFIEEPATQQLILQGDSSTPTYTLEEYLTLQKM